MKRTTLPMRMPLGALAAAMLSLGMLSACQPSSSQAPSAAAANAETPAPAAAAGTAPAQTVKDSPAVATDKGEVTLAHWDGYGDSKFGIDQTQFRSDWGGDLKQGGTDSACHHLSPLGQKTQSELAFMFNDGKFTRYSVDSARLSAPGGGKVGMRAAQIAQLYGGGIEETPHKYVEGGRYLRIVRGANVLIFETDATGTVSEWRVGVPPQVDYVEGCS